MSKILYALAQFERGIDENESEKPFEVKARFGTVKIFEKFWSKPESPEC